MIFIYIFFHWFFLVVIYSLIFLISSLTSSNNFLILYCPYFFVIFLYFQIIFYLSLFTTTTSYGLNSPKMGKEVWNFYFNFRWRKNAIKIIVFCQYEIIQKNWKKCQQKNKIYKHRVKFIKRMAAQCRIQNIVYLDTFFSLLTQSP